MSDINKHFSAIAQIYKGMRTTDIEPILFIEAKLKGLDKIEAADVGCGTGRYSIALAKYFGEKFHLTCIDDNEEMLEVLDRNGIPLSKVGHIMCD